MSERPPPPRHWCHLHRRLAWNFASLVKGRRWVLSRLRRAQRGTATTSLITASTTPSKSTAPAHPDVSDMSPLPVWNLTKVVDKLAEQSHSLSHGGQGDGPATNTMAAMIFFMAVLASRPGRCSPGLPSRHARTHRCGHRAPPSQSWCPNQLPHVAGRDEVPLLRACGSVTEVSANDVAEFDPVLTVLAVGRQGGVEALEVRRVVRRAVGISCPGPE